MHLYTLVAAPFVTQLIGAAGTIDGRVGRYGSLIQGGFLRGWALGGGVGSSAGLAIDWATYGR